MTKKKKKKKKRYTDLENISIKFTKFGELLLGALILLKTKKSRQQTIFWGELYINICVELFKLLKTSTLKDFLIIYF